MTFVKGQSGNPNGREEGSKNKVTLAKEERRAVFDEEVSKEWIATIKKLKAEYVADQFMGKAPDELHVKQLIVQVSKEIAEKNGIASSPEQNSERLAPIQSVKVWEEIREDKPDSRRSEGEVTKQT